MALSTPVFWSAHYFAGPVLKFQLKIKHFKFGLVAYACSPSTSKWTEDPIRSRGYIGYIGPLPGRGVWGHTILDVLATDLAAQGGYQRVERATRWPACFLPSVKNRLHRSCRAAGAPKPEFNLHKSCLERAHSTST